MIKNRSIHVIRNGRRFILLGILLVFIFTFTLVTSADPVITVTKSDALLTDADNSSGLTPGDTIRYTVEIENTGDMDATNVVFDDVIDDQTTLSGVAHVSPIAFDDSYTSLGNVGITVPAVSGVLANDVDPDNSVSLSVIAAAGATTNGGAFAIGADGGFSYLPPAGFEGTDTFTYTLTDGDPITPNASGTVTITVDEVIWFVEKSAGSGGTGVLNNPFNDLTGASGYSNAADDPGDIIFIYDQQVAGNYNGAITLQNNQFIVGQGATASIVAITGITVPPHSNGLPATGGSKPVLSNSAGNNVLLAQNNTIRGISLDDSTGGYGFVDNGGTVSNLAISETNVGGTGGAVNIANGGTLAVTLEYANSTNSPGFGINLNNVAGSFTVTGNMTINSPAAGGINITGSSATVSFNGGTKTINTGAQTAVNLSSNTGTINFSNGGLDIDTTSGTGFSASSGGTVNISGSNNSITSSSGSAVDIDNTALNVTLRSVASVGGTVPGIDLNTTTGTFSVTGDGATTGSGGSISGKTGNTNGVTLNNANGVSLAFMNINNNSRNGLYGLNINGLTLNGVTLNANADQFSPDEAGLLLEEVNGTVNITNSTVSNSFEHNVKILNSSGTLTAFNLTGGTIGPNPVGTGAQGLLFQGTGTANMTLSVDGTTFTGNLSNGIFADTAGGTMDVTVQNSIFENNNVGVGVSVSSSGNMTFDILNNPTIRSLSQVQSLGIRAFANASHSGTFAGTISGNTVGSVGSTASGSIDGSGISASNEGSGTMTLLISGNTVQEVGGTGNGFEGIFVTEAVNAGTTNATITGNTIRNIRDDRAIQVAIPSGNGTVCSNISSNSFTDTIDGDNPINASTRVIRVRQVTGTHNVVQSSQANLASVNSLASGNITVSGTINFGASACATPSLAATSASSHLAKTVGQPTLGKQIVGQQAKIINSTDETITPKPVSDTQRPASSAKLSNPNSAVNTLLPIGDVNETIGTLPPGKKVTIIFDVTVNTPTQASDLIAQICNTGSVTADTGINVNSNQICRSFQTGTINIIKDTVPDGPQDFGFTAGGGLAPANFALDDDADGTLSNTQSFSSVAPGAYNVSEDDPSALSYQLTALVCDDDASNVASVENVGTRTATINLEPGETISCTFTNEINRDWGDLPDTYGTTATTGASHLISGPYLGLCLDGETSGVPSADALADNNATGSPQIGNCTNPDDEDGVSFVNANNWSGGNGRFDITVNNGDACLNAWLDFTDGITLLPIGDGDFDDSLAGNDEHIVANLPVSSSDSQPIAVNFTLPNNAADGAALYLRVRLTERDDAGACNGIDTYAAGSPTPAGHAFTGEVEDYQVTFTPTAVSLQTFSATSTPITSRLLVLVLTLLVLPSFYLWRHFQTKRGILHKYTFNQMWLNHCRFGKDKGKNMIKTIPHQLFNKRIFVATLIFIGAFFLINSLGLVPTVGAVPSVVTVLGTPVSQYGTSKTLSNFTVSAGTNRLLVVVASHTNSTGMNNVTFDGTSMTQVVLEEDGFAVDTIWVMAMGDSGSSTTGDIVITPSGGSASDQSFIAAVVFANVDQTTPVDASPCPPSGTNCRDEQGSGPITSNLIIPSEDGDLIFDVFDSFDNSAAVNHTIGAGQTLLHHSPSSPISSGGNGSYSTSIEDGATSVTSTWTTSGSALIHMAININAAPPPSADLSISKVDDIDPIVAGNTLEYTVTVTNAGPDSATNVQVTDTLPAGVTLVSTNGCTEDPNGVPTCSLGTIAASSSAQYTIQVTVDAGTTGVITNNASVASDTNDPNTNNNSTSENTTVNAPSADLSISKVDDVDPIVASNTLVYTVRVDNAGPQTAENVQVTDTLPAGVTFVATTGCTEDPNGVPTCSLGVIVSGGFAEFTIEVMVDAGTTGIITNTASVSSDTTDPISNNNSTTEDTTVNAPTADLSISKIDDVDPIVAGNTLVYTVRVDNAGPQTAENVKVTDTLPAGVTLVSTSGCTEDPNGVTTCSLGDMPSGGFAEFTIEVTVDVATSGTITNNASVSSNTVDPNTTNNSTSEDTSVNALHDWGDLPDSYGTSAPTGANHFISGPYLGECRDGEFSGVPSTDALADDNAIGALQDGNCTDPDDEDGVSFINSNNWSGGNGRFDITVNNGDSCLNAWLDFTNGAILLPTGDGDFDDSLAGNDEHIVANLPVSSSDSQPIAVNFTLPNNAADGAMLYLRVRLTERDDGDACNGLDTYEAGSPTSAGHAFTGEVEDYQVSFTPTAVNLQQVSTTGSTVNFVFTVTLLGLLTLTTLFMRKRSMR